MRYKYIQYYVEGDDEEKLISVLKTQMGVIRPGKVQKFNVVENEISDMRLRTLLPGTMVVLIFDTDTGHLDILQRNIIKLKSCAAVSEVVTIPQVPNLEGELIHSCNIKNITELLNSKSRKEFKTDFLRVSNLEKKLMEHGFSMQSFWTGNPPAPYESISNQSSKIKLQRK